MEMTWTSLLNGQRRKDREQKPSALPAYGLSKESRTEFERDHDRILFSTPFRRLIDKTQVFPLEKKHDTIRRRLTHSLEVGNLCRSVGIDLAFNHQHIFGAAPCPQRNVPGILASIGLAHDLGNPPFGHKGEEAIRQWFVQKESESKGKIFEGLSKQQRQDFLRFEGNAQTFRLLTKLQLLNDNFGLNLTYGTLSALMKYTVSSIRLVKDDARPEKKKIGFYFSEEKQARELQRIAGTGECRNPLAYIVEACDDTAYTILDAEDAAKKGLVSYADIEAHLRATCKDDGLADTILNSAEKKHGEFREKFKEDKLSPRELDDISMQMFRVYAFQKIMPEITKAFVQKSGQMLKGKFSGTLLDATKAAAFCEAMRTFDRHHAYRNQEVRGIELKGYNIIRGLMNLLWEGISKRDEAGERKGARGEPFANYAYSRISENYRRVFLENKDGLPIRYRELQLLTDMISGMTDSYAVDLFEDLKGRKNGN